MKKNDYIITLSSHLKSFIESDRQEILSDIEEHFSNGTREGKTEDEISSALGDPAIIAKQYSQPDTDNNTINQKINSNTTTIVKNNTNKSATNIVILIVLNLCLVSWILPAIFGIVIGFWTAAVVIFVTGIVVFFASLITTPALGPAGIFAGIGLISLGLLAGVGMFYGTIALIKVLIKYIKWNVRFAKGDA